MVLTPSVLDQTQGQFKSREALTKGVDYVTPSDGVVTIYGTKTANWYGYVEERDVSVYTLFRIANPPSGMSASSTIASCFVKKGTTIRYDASDSDGSCFFVKY